MPHPRGHQRPRRPPPWWPEGEPWPPRSGPGRPPWFFLRFFPLLIVGWLAFHLLGDLFGPAGYRWTVLAATLLVTFAVAGVALSGWRMANAINARRRADERRSKQLMADAAHELRTPLAVIRAQAEGIADGVYPGDAAHLAPILEATRNLERLVDDLRTLSESGTIVPALQTVELRDLLAEVQTAHQAAAAEAGVTLLLEGPGAAVQADPGRLRQVLDNLVVNALRHTPRGGVVRLGGHPDGSRALVEVTDTGSGIAPELLPRIFDRFAKGAGSPGSGLGLAIARELVRAQGGEITVASEPGQGATFRIRLG